MTRLDPSLRLARLVVTKDGHRAYDEAFHVGVNIIRGVPGQANSVGKSTIADLIFYGLGGDLFAWKDEAKSCDLVFTEVVLNGSVVTLRREITENSQQPMWIFFGNFETSISSADEGWQKYPYRRYGDKESFTQVLFRLMSMPEVPAEAESNITMHQILRLMYVDQMTPVDRIFRFEAKDSPLRRQAVGDVLCGMFDERLYPAQLALRDKEKEYEAATQQFTALHRVLTTAGESFNLDFVTARKKNLEQELIQIREQINTLKGRRFDDVNRTPTEQGIVEALKSDLDKINKDISDRQVDVGQLTYAIEDAAQLIAEIEQTRTRLKEGELTSSTIGAMTFMFCPSCFSPLSDQENDHTCRLCKSVAPPAEDQSRFARMRNELDIQYKESEHLQEKREAQLAQEKLQIKKLTAIRDGIAAEYLNLTRNYLTEADAQIDRLTSRVGYLERELIDLQREQSLADQLNALSEARALLNVEISVLKDNIARWRDQRDKRQGEIYQLIQRLTAELLAKDLQSEAEFTEHSNVYFDFAEDRITVNDKSGFSASSLTMIRNSFHLALHLASCKNQGMRYPRFLLLDNIEDKGMTEQRSQNFQRVIVEMSERIAVDHQIIFTTSMIDSDLDVSPMTVGERYDFAHKTLKIGRPVETNQ